MNIVQVFCAACNVRNYICVLLFNVLNSYTLNLYTHTHQPLFLFYTKYMYSSDIFMKAIKFVWNRNETVLIVDNSYKEIYKARMPQSSIKSFQSNVFRL